MQLQTILRGSLALFVVAGIACSGSDDPEDVGTTDTGTADSGGADAGSVDMGGADAGSDDATVGDTGTDAGTGDAGQDDTFEIAGLSAAVEIHQDSQGVLQIICQTNSDCFAAQGYMHAKHRFAQMDVRRRFARGTLSELFGAAALQVDRINRRDIATRDGGRLEDQVWAASSPELQQAITDYTRGVNTWLADLRAGRNGAKLSDEYSGFTQFLSDWTELDSVGAGMAVVEGLSNHIGNEINAGFAFGALSSSVAFDLYALTPASPSTIVPRSGITAEINELPRSVDLDSVSARMQVVNKILADLKTKDTALDLDKGSNNWIVGPGNSASGNALLANDPHLGLENPALWYLVTLDSKSEGQGDLHIGGMSFAGMPGVILGQNEDLAWGATVTFFDHSDAYTETLTRDGSGVVFNGQDVPFVEREFTFNVNGGNPVTETFSYVPHHGPVVGRDDQAGVAVTIKWAGQDATTDLNFLSQVWVATNVDEAQTAFEQITTFGQNLIVADRSGTIAWLPYNKLPARPWASAAIPAWLPVPGDGSAEWGPYLEYSQLPQAIDPPAGYLATANNDMTGTLQDGDPANDGTPWHQTFLAPGFRHERIEQVLSASTQHTLQGMQELQGDTHSLLGERVVPLVSAGISGRTLTAEQQSVLDAMANWAFTCPTGLIGTDPQGTVDADAVITAESAGCTAFHAFWPRLMDAVFLDEITPAGISARPLERALLNIMGSPQNLILGEAYFDNVDTAGVETKADAIAEALEGAAMYLAATFSADPNDWRWGRVHTLTLRAPLLNDAGITRFNHGPFANDGGLHTVDVANPRNLYSDNYGHGAGASVRFACELGTTADCTYELPGGQVHFRDDTHYDSAFEAWLTNVPAPLQFQVADIRANSTAEFTINPE